MSHNQSKQKQDFKRLLTSSEIQWHKGLTRVLSISMIKITIMN
jgi:hypothetical protein